MGGGSFVNQTSTYTASTATGILTAPASTATDDLMIGMLMHSVDNMADGEDNLDGWVEPFPTGWIQIYYYRYLADPPYSVDGRRLSLFFKVATSGDTPGTTYTFNRATGYLDGKVWAATLTFRGIGAYGGSTTHNLTNWARRWTTSRSTVFSSANNVLAPRYSDNRMLGLVIVSRYGMEAVVPTAAQSGNDWTQHVVVREGTLSSSYCVSIGSTPGSPTTGVLQMPTIPTQQWKTAASPYGYTSEYDTLLLELVTTENALLLDPVVTSSSTKKESLTPAQLLEQQGNRARLIEYSREQRTGLYLPVDKQYAQDRGYISTNTDRTDKSILRKDYIKKGLIR